MSETVKLVSARTSFLEERCNFTWSIENFSSCGQQFTAAECLTSPKFTTGQFSSPSWCIRLYPNETLEESDEDYIAVFLQRIVAEETSTHYANFEISIVDSGHAKRHTKVGDHLFTEEENDFGYDLVSREEVIYGESSSSLIPNDTLTLLVELTVRVDVTKFVTKQPVFKDSGAPIIPQNPFSVIGSLRRLYDTGMFSDFTIKVGGEELKVHKLILSVQSTVFQTMLTCEMKENITNCVEIDDFDPQVVKTMLRYIYTGQVGNLTLEIGIQLYSIADKYNLQGLKNICVKFLLRNLNIDNICDVLVLGDMHNETELMTAVKKMFCENAAAIQTTERWFDLSRTNPDLTMSMYRHLVSNIDMGGIAMPDPAKKARLQKEKRSLNLLTLTALTCGLASLRR